MGLDMYLTKRVYVGAEWEHRNVTGTIDIRQNGEPIKVNFNKVSTIEEKVATWRKANAIHKWFVDNVQDGVDDCHEYWVSREQLKELLDIVKKVLESSKIVKGVVVNGQTVVDGKCKNNYESGETIENPEVAEELLPTADGFFFGGTDYDQWYIDDLKYTKKVLEEVLAEDNSSDYYYQSSW